MTVEPSYIPAVVPYPERIHVGRPIAMWQDPPRVVEQLVDAGVLLPDDRLKAIADAPRCEHGKIDEHTTEYHPLKDRRLDGHICPGALELRGLLDALTEEER